MDARGGRAPQGRLRRRRCATCAAADEAGVREPVRKGAPCGTGTAAGEDRQSWLAFIAREVENIKWSFRYTTLGSAKFSLLVDPGSVAIRPATMPARHGLYHHDRTASGRDEALKDARAAAARGRPDGGR